MSLLSSSPSSDSKAASSKVLKQYVNDMATLNQHIAEALDRQHHDEHLNEFQKAKVLISSAHAIFRRHGDEMHQEVHRLGGALEVAAKEAITHVLGLFASIYDKLRNEPVSRMMRDDYTAFNLAAISCTMLHTVALAFDDKAVAAVALKHLNELTSLIMGFNEIIPDIIVAELRDDPGANTLVAPEAVQNTQRAWKRT